MAENDILAMQETAEGTLKEVVLAADNLKIGTTSGLPVKTGTDGVLQVGAFGSAAGEFCAGNDARFPDQDLYTSDDVTFNSVTASTEVAPAIFGGGDIRGGRIIATVRTDGSSDLPAQQVFESAGTTNTLTVEVPNSLAANRQINYPDASGTLALTSDITKSAVGLGNVSNTAQVTSVTGTAPIVSSGGTTPAISVTVGTTANTVAAGDDSRITGAAQKASNLSDLASASTARTNLGLGTAATAASGDFAAASHTHAASAIISGTIDTARLASGTANSGTYLRGDQTWAAVSGVTTGSVDNAILRADGTGGSTSQSSDINIEDATTVTQANVAIVNNHSETNSALVLTPKGNGAFIVGPRQDGTTTGGNARGANAVCIGGSRSAATQVASGANAVRIGTNATASGNSSVSLLGNATQAFSVAVGSASNATGNQSSVAIGYFSNASGGNSTALGIEAASSGSDSVALGGNASGTTSAAIARTASASGVNSVAIGQSATASLRAQFAAKSFQCIYWGGETTTNTATILNLDATATNRFTIAANTALAVDILLVARRSDVADKWLVARRFLGIRRDGSNNTSLIGTVQTLGTDQSAGSPTWTFALTADDTNEALQLEVTGATSETVQWRATAFYRVV